MATTVAAKYTCALAELVVEEIHAHQYDTFAAFFPGKDHQQLALWLPKLKGAPSTMTTFGYHRGGSTCLFYRIGGDEYDHHNLYPIFLYSSLGRANDPSSVDLDLSIQPTKLSIPLGLAQM